MIRFQWRLVESRPPMFCMLLFILIHPFIIVARVKSTGRVLGHELVNRVRMGYSECQAYSRQLFMHATQEQKTSLRRKAAAGTILHLKSSFIVSPMLQDLYLTHSNAYNPIQRRITQQMAAVP